jgi:hypothetical protein
MSACPSACQRPRVRGRDSREKLKTKIRMRMGMPIPYGEGRRRNRESGRSRRMSKFIHETKMNFDRIGNGNNTGREQMMTVEMVSDACIIMVWIYKLTLDACHNYSCSLVLLLITHVACSGAPSHHSRSLVLLLIFRFILIRPLSFNMFLWHLLASHSLVILIVLLVAPTPLDALPVNVSLQFPRGDNKCDDNCPAPCICDNAYSIASDLSRARCGPAVFNYATSEDNTLTMVSHRSSLVTPCTGDDITM